MSVKQKQTNRPGTNKVRVLKVGLAGLRFGAVKYGKDTCGY